MLKIKVRRKKNTGISAAWQAKMPGKIFAEIGVQLSKYTAVNESWSNKHMRLTNGERKTGRKWQQIRYRYKRSLAGKSARKNIC